MSKIILDPIRLLETPSGIAKVQSAAVALSVANNQTIVPAVTGARIRVMGWKAHGTTGTAGTMLLKSASGGATISPTLPIPANTTFPADILPLSLTGYCETVAGEGLFADVTGAAISLFLWYITYTP